MRLALNQVGRAPVHFGGGAGGQLAEHEVARLPLDQAEQAVAVPLGAEDGVGFPVANARAGLHHGRARREGPFPGETPAAVVVPVALPTLFLRAPEMGL